MERANGVLSSSVSTPVEARSPAVRYDGEPGAGCGPNREVSVCSDCRTEDSLPSVWWMSLTVSRETDSSGEAGPEGAVSRETPSATSEAHSCG
jgi:hypothetical protein